MHLLTVTVAYTGGSRGKGGGRAIRQKTYSLSSLSPIIGLLYIGLAIFVFQLLDSLVVAERKQRKQL